MAGKILITPNTGSTTTDPTIVFQGSGSTSEITQRVTSLGTISFEHTAGTILQLTSGTNGNVLVGTSTDDGVHKLQVNGSVSATSFVGNATTASKLSAPFTVNGVSIDGSTNVTIGTPSPYYDIHNFINGKPLVNEILVRVIAVRAFALAANCAGSYAFCTTPATAAFQLSLLKNGAEFGTITFNIGAATGVFNSPAASFNISDQFAIRCKTGVQDVSLSDIAISLFGTA